MSGETRAKAEVAMMGIVVVPDSNEEAIEIMEYIIKTLNASGKITDLTGAELYSNAFQYAGKTSKKVVYGLCAHTLTIGYDNMKCITVIEEKKKNLDTPMGIFCWVENLNAPDCSECGYCFFRKDERGLFHRIS